MKPYTRAQLLRAMTALFPDRGRFYQRHDRAASRPGGRPVEPDAEARPGPGDGGCIPPAGDED